LGNFISNQRRETLGDEYKRTEDGLLVQFNIEKDEEKDETSITEVTYIPTWVYKSEENEEETYEYKIIPIEPFLDSEEEAIETFQSIPVKRLNESLESTKELLQIE